MQPGLWMLLGGWLWGGHCSSQWADASIHCEPQEQVAPTGASLVHKWWPGGPLGAPLGPPLAAWGACWGRPCPPAAPPLPPCCPTGPPVGQQWAAGAPGWAAVSTPAAHCCSLVQHWCPLVPHCCPPVPHPCPPAAPLGSQWVCSAPMMSAVGGQGGLAQPCTTMHNHALQAAGCRLPAGSVMVGFQMFHRF